MNDDKLKGFIQDHRADFDEATPPAGLWDRIAAALPPDEEDADPLETFIATHREAFDDATPPPQLLTKVLAPAAPATSVPKLTVSHRRRTFLYLTGIAACLLLMFTAYRFGNRAGYQAGQEGRVAQQIQQLDPELAEAERFYQQRIDAEFTRVNQVNDDPQLRRDLQEFDKATADIRAQLLEVPQSQRPVLVNELIEAYRTKLDILLHIQQRIPTPNPSGAPVPRPNKSTRES